MGFAEFPEHTQVVSLLQRSLAHGRLGHAYLFAGGQLEVLERAARALSKTLNCLTPPERGASGTALDCCDRCLNCRKIESGNHADVQWVRPESKLRVVTVDQMRELMRVVHMKPVEAVYKVAIIVAADRLNPQAANAFLKTLEEPPQGSVLMLLTTEPGQLLDTISSRCLRLNFGGELSRPADPAQLAWLRAFSESAARDQRGGLLGRYRLLGMLAAELARLKERIEADLTARSPLEANEDADPRLRERWEEELVAAIEAEYRRQRTGALAALEWWLRDVWLLSLRLKEAPLSFPELVDGAQAVAARIPPAQAMENLRVLERTQWTLGSNVQEALALEVGLLELKL